MLFNNRKRAAYLCFLLLMLAATFVSGCGSASKKPSDDEIASAFQNLKYYVSIRDVEVTHLGMCEEISTSGKAQGITAAALVQITYESDLLGDYKKFEDDRGSSRLYILKDGQWEATETLDQCP